jgi:uncharacterized membrane protein YoaK (UPF0700 family)
VSRWDVDDPARQHFASLSSAGREELAAFMNAAALIVGLGAAMGIQNAAARKIAMPDLTTTVLTLTITGIAADSALAGGPGSKAGGRLIALVTIVLGAVTSRILGRPDPAWVHAPA